MPLPALSGRQYQRGGAYEFGFGEAGTIRACNCRHGKPSFGVAKTCGNRGQTTRTGSPPRCAARSNRSWEGCEGSTVGKTGSVVNAGGPRDRCSGLKIVSPSDALTLVYRKEDDGIMVSRYRFAKGDGVALWGLGWDRWKSCDPGTSA